MVPPRPPSYSRASPWGRTQGQDGLGEGILSFPGTPAEAQAHAKATPAGAHPWSATARVGPPRRTEPGRGHVRSHAGPSLPSWGMADPSVHTPWVPPTPVSLSFQVPKHTVFTTCHLRPNHSLRPESLPPLCPSKLIPTHPLKGILEKTSPDSPNYLRCPIASRARPGSDSFFYLGPFPRRGTF